MLRTGRSLTASDLAHLERDIEEPKKKRRSVTHQDLAERAFCNAVARRARDDGHRFVEELYHYAEDFYAQYALEGIDLTDERWLRETVEKLCTRAGDLHARFTEKVRPEFLGGAGEQARGEWHHVARALACIARRNLGEEDDWSWPDQPTAGDPRQRPLDQ